MLDRKWRGDLSYQRDATPYVFYRVILVAFLHPNSIQSDANHTEAYLVVPHFIILYLTLPYHYLILHPPTLTPIHTNFIIPYLNLTLYNPYSYPLFSLT